MIVVLANCKLQYNCVRNAAVFYLWNYVYKTVSFLNKFLRTSNLFGFTDRNLFLKISAQYDSNSIQCFCLRLTKLISGEISTSINSLYFVAVRWLKITDGHAVIVLDTHSNFTFKYMHCWRKIYQVSLAAGLSWSHLTIYTLQKYCSLTCLCFKTRND